MTKYSEKLIKIIDSLIAKIEQLQASKVTNGKESWYSDSIQYEAITTEIIAILAHIYGVGDPTYERIKSHVEYGHFEDSVKGGLIGTKCNIENGLLDDLAEKITADIEIDFLNSAQILYEQKQKDPASVLACIVLEDSLKRLAEKHGENDLRGKVLTKVAQGLLEKEIIDKASHHAILSFKTLRDAALHANWDKVEEDDIKRLFTFIPIFIEKFGV